jgi:hypothetical protein
MLGRSANSGLKETKRSMSDSRPQNLKNHARLDPSYHLILLTVLVVNLFIVLCFAWRDLNYFTEWIVILSIAAFIPMVKLRSYPLKVQDRIIRLEERLRLQALAPTQWHVQIYRLNEDQLIGLRFASDEEVVDLAKLALEENLTRKQIKERIKIWRGDDWRI